MNARLMVAAMVSVFGVFGGLVEAQLPDDRIVSLLIRETPSDPESDVEFVVEVWVAAEEVDGDEVGWRVDMVQIKRLDEEGEVADKWSEALPEVQTSDGLWWIEHADAASPETEEFVLPPLMLGTAVSEDPQNDDLVYDVLGSVYQAPPGGPMFPITASLSFTFTSDGSTLKEGEEEPAEVPVDPNQPE